MKSPSHPAVRMPHPARGLPRALGLAALLLAGACTSPVSVDGSWVERPGSSPEFSNLLVVGVSPDYNMRCRFERALADDLRNDQVRATASCAQMRASDPLTRERVVEVVKEMGADAVLATRLVNQKPRLDKGTGDDTRQDYYYKPVGYGLSDDYFGYFGLPVTYVEFTSNPPVLTLESTVQIATNLYRASDAALLYTMVSKARNVDSAGNFINQVSSGISAQLRDEGLVR
jgi:hypothetical protein